MEKLLTFLHALTIFFKSYSEESPCTVVRVLRPFRCWILICTRPSWTSSSEPLIASAKGSAKRGRNKISRYANTHRRTIARDDARGAAREQRRRHFDRFPRVRVPRLRCRPLLRYFFFFFYRPRFRGKDDDTIGYNGVATTREEGGDKKRDREMVKNLEEIAHEEGRLIIQCGCFSYSPNVLRFWMDIRQTKEIPRML